ncbi:uncharacterized protein JN550_005453 [Neoarthrinium moseri]|uniref:uncharacterized protein n=1 Tax=Neoarthrinium moseri TaxID=1658444 RepID=UPI001FDD8F56|nr:uncharacterized protein JN550_005453 [Neoarthrinium moseri]KAI1869863.1 hypothetical protein JN550_005453 [Neoarthrinium moseri]
MLSPPFSQGNSLRPPGQAALVPLLVRHDSGLLNPMKDAAQTLEVELSTPRLDKMAKWLWLAGLPRPARPLHRQLQLQRSIHLTESVDEHLIWHESSIFIKPVPEYLLNFEFWTSRICGDVALYKCACGLLFSYAWLVGHKSDFRIAQNTGIIPDDISWGQWTDFMRDFIARVQPRLTHHISNRYTYGELRLSRLNTLYRFTTPISARKLVIGFMSTSNRRKIFFKQHFGWFLAAFAYISVILSAMQVGLGTDALQNSAQFQNVSYGVSLSAIYVVIISIAFIVIVWFGLFWFHLLSTLGLTKSVKYKHFVV